MSYTFIDENFERKFQEDENLWNPNRKKRKRRYSL